MIYRCCLLLSVMFCSALASEKPHYLVAKMSALMTSVAKKIPGTQAHLAHTVIQELDTHLTPNITNIVIESLGTDSMRINIADLWQTFLSHNGVERQTTEIGVYSVDQSWCPYNKKYNNCVYILAAIREQNKILLKVFSCDVLGDSGFTVSDLIPAPYYRAEHVFHAMTPESIQQESFKNMFPQRSLAQQTLLTKDGRHIQVKPLDYIVGQGARNVEVSLPDDTGRCLVTYDSTRFKPHRTWSVLSKVRQEQKVD